MKTELMVHSATKAQCACSQDADFEFCHGLSAIVDGESRQDPTQQFRTMLPAEASQPLDLILLHSI